MELTLFYFSSFFHWIENNSTEFYTILPKSQTAMSWSRTAMRAWFDS